MQTVKYNETALPIEALKKIGLANENGILMDKKDINALLSGGRTGLVQLKDFDYGGMEIKALLVKLSLVKNSDGKQELLFHPVYKQLQQPAFISAQEADDLISGLKSNLLKKVDRNGTSKETLIEYDWDTREFVMTGTSGLKVPNEVNGIALSPYQKERYSKGRQIELGDGTIIQASSTTPDGIRSNKLALVVSVLMDGGLSYMLFTGLKALVGERGMLAQTNERSENFKTALQKYEKQQSAEISPEISEKLSNRAEHSRGYGRSGSSR